MFIIVFEIRNISSLCNRVVPKSGTGEQNKHMLADEINLYIITYQLKQ